MAQALVAVVVALLFLNTRWKCSLILRYSLYFKIKNDRLVIFI